MRVVQAPAQPVLKGIGGWERPRGERGPSRGVRAVEIDGSIPPESPRLWVGGPSAFVPRGAAVRHELRKHYASVALKLASLRIPVDQPPPGTRGTISLRGLFPANASSAIAR